MKNVLIVSGHTNLSDSVANKSVLECVKKNAPEVTIDYLDKLYGDGFQIDVAAEQAKLESADVIVLQFPVFWYSTPSLMQRWMEQVFQHGWSHGTTGSKLKGKKLIISLTTGAPEEMYSHEGSMGHTIEEFCYPLMATCNLTGMECAGIIYTGGVSYQSRTDEAALAGMKERAANHAQRLLDLIEAL